MWPLGCAVTVTYIWHWKIGQMASQSFTKLSNEDFNCSANYQGWEAEDADIPEDNWDEAIRILEGHPHRRRQCNDFGADEAAEVTERAQDATLVPINKDLARGRITINTTIERQTGWQCVPWIQKKSIAYVEEADIDGVHPLKDGVEGHISGDAKQWQANRKMYEMLPCNSSVAGHFRASSCAAQLCGFKPLVEDPCA
ncbi:hypothetical protein GQ600_18557 [Phytophthora cactorum]|nr:hypothetical protein GQ600_18557 [Phytophthora cactorum]